MKKVSILLILLLAGIKADYIEIKTAQGKEALIIKKAPKLYVCYDKRIKIVNDDGIFLHYEGCALYRHSCKSNKKARFGKYPNEKEAKKALYRCKTSQPRFID